MSPDFIVKILSIGSGSVDIVITRLFDLCDKFPAGCPDYPAVFQDMDNIRDMFLMESGFIGLMGGVVGIILSLSISKIINVLYMQSNAAMYSMSAGDISRIPIWLLGLALIFAVLVGMLAGLFPALRAMRLSPLSAIRNE